MIARELIHEEQGRRPSLSVVRRSVPADLVRDDEHGHYRLTRRHLLHRMQPDPMQPTPHARLLAWLRDNVHPCIPRGYYRAVLGHDLHIGTYARLYVKHFHASEPDPFTGELGWLEDVGLVSQGKVTVAFRDFEIDNLIADSTTYGDFKFHRPGTSATAEANTDTALVTDAGLEATGTQVEASAAVYRSVATVTADTTETWQEHSIRSATGATGGTMMDRSLISPTVAVVNLDTVQFTYEITKTAEA